ncbi:hypothetical protein Acr_17g0008290 [Actinidia rufa]|uniref:S-protein homolog n=1 Tax=Actinidia rufa TaxID=165716 RepID=A0A7J0G3A6_9ERIC|nr:hypothetical protein Acr_17g0008290 [Actinidia rufa]
MIRTLVAFLILTFYLACSASEDALTARYEVHIVDDLNDAVNNLTVHCQSGDQNIPYRYLHPHEDFYFGFNLQIFNKSLFFCHFWWAGRQQTFDVYNKSYAQKCLRHDQDTNTCYWSVRSDGFYFANYPFPPLSSYWQKVYDWQ